MPAVKKICRVCNKEYEACRTEKPNFGEFRWQEVACSPECGEVYLNRILESRGLKQPEVDAQSESVSGSHTTKRVRRKKTTVEHTESAE